MAVDKNAQKRILLVFGSRKHSMANCDTSSQFTAKKLVKNLVSQAHQQSCWSLSVHGRLRMKTHSQLPSWISMTIWRWVSYMSWISPGCSVLWEGWRMVVSGLSLIGVGPWHTLYMCMRLIRCWMDLNIYVNINDIYFNYFVRYQPMAGWWQAQKKLVHNSRKINQI